MRPYLVLCVVLLVSAAAFGQHPVPRFSGDCLWGCGPFIPLVTTPSVSLQTVSPNPVGASNATTGLIAGATNGTLSQISGSTNSTYTVPVWYEGGGAPVMSPEVHLWAQPIQHEVRARHEVQAQGEEAHADWLFFPGSEQTTSAMRASTAARSGKKATRSFSNADVERQNQNTGTVKYGGKTEKVQ
jgi:hypothetical protein